MNEEKWVGNIGESINEEQILKVLIKSRESMLTKYFSNYSTIPKQAGIDIVNTISTTEIVPLYRHIRSGVKSLLIKGSTNLIHDPDQYLEKVNEYFEKNPEHMMFFAHITFPQLCFSFLSSELIEVGYNFIMSSLKLQNKLLFQRLFIAFIDSFPDFIQSLTAKFRSSILERHTPVHAFINALHSSFYFLTAYHQKIIEFCRENHPNTLVEALFKLYLPDYFSTDLLSCSDYTFLRANSQLRSIFEFIVSHPMSTIASSILDAFKAESFDTRRNVRLSLDLGLKVVHYIISPHESYILTSIFSECNIVKIPVIGNQPLIPADLVQNMCHASASYNLSAVYDGEIEKKKPRCSDAEKTIEENYSPEEIQDFKVSLAKLNHIAEKNRMSTKELIVSQHNLKVSNQLNSIFGENPKIKEYLQLYFKNLEEERMKTINKSIKWHAALRKVIENYNSFTFDIIANLDKQIYEYTKEKCIDSTKQSTKEVNLKTNKNLLLKYSKNISVSLNNVKSSIEINKSVIKMKGISLDQMIHDSITPNCDSNIMFLTMISYLSLWNFTQSYDIDFTTILQPFLSYERFLFINSKRAHLMNSKLYKDIILAIRNSVKNNMGRRIIEIIRIVNSIFKSGLENPVEILHDCLIASGVDDSIVSFLYYIHLLTYFPKLFKDGWMESNTNILAIRDTMFVNMMAVSNKLYKFVINFFYEAAASPLMIME